MERQPSPARRTNSNPHLNSFNVERLYHRQASRESASSRPSILSLARSSTLPTFPSPLHNTASVSDEQDADSSDRRLSAFSMHLAKYDLSWKYHLGSILGSGVSADVYKATSILTDEEVAIKVFKDSTPTGTHAAATEYLCAMRAAGPCALEYHSVAFMNGKPALVMDLADMPLDKWIKGYTYSAAAASTESDSGGSLSSFTSASTPPRISSDTAAPPASQNVATTDAAVPSLLQLLPSPTGNDPAAQDAEQSEPALHSPHHSKKSCSSAEMKKFEWHGDFPPLVDIMRIQNAILEGLMAMHEAGLAHCDLKPANILLLPDGSTKIADFGAACAINTYSGKLATMHGNVMRDREIERLMKHHMIHNCRTTEDSMSAFGSAWGGTEVKGLSSAQNGLGDSSCDKTQPRTGSCGPIEENGNDPRIRFISKMKIPEAPPPFSLHEQPPAQQSLATSLAEQPHSAGEPTLLFMQPFFEQQQEVECTDQPEGVELCERPAGFLRTKSALVRSFRSCPGSSQTLDSAEDPGVKTDRRGVRWCSGSGGDRVVSQQIEPRSTAGENLLPTQASTGSCSRIKAYSLRDVPMFTSTYSSPERSNNADQRKVDVWAAGCILYELCTGMSFMRPQRGASIYTLMAQLHDPNWTAPEHCLPQSMACWRPMLNAMLCRDPAQRPLPRELLRFEVLRSFRSQQKTRNSCRGRTFNGNFSLNQRHRVSSCAVMLHPLLRPSGVSHALVTQSVVDADGAAVEETTSDVQNRFRVSL